MPYERRSKCIFRKDTRKKVGCSKTVSKAKKYFKKLHMVEDFSLSFDDIFREALSLSQAREHKMSRKYSNAYNIPQLKELFGNKDRVIYPFELNTASDFSYIEEDPSNSYNVIKNFLSKKGFIINDVKDYILNRCYKQNDKNVYTIGKVLAKIGTPIKLRTKKGTSIDTTREAEMYKSDPVKEIKLVDMVIVFSRHPYDLYGMSTGRSWVSCMSIDKKEIDDEGDESQCQAIPFEVQNGSIIAYLVPKSELTAQGKIGIRKPVSRILLRPLINDSKELAYSVGPMYGAQIPKFNDVVSSWIDTNINSKIKDKANFKFITGLYSRDPAEVPGIEVSQLPPGVIKSNYERNSYNLFDKFKTRMVNAYNMIGGQFSTYYSYNTDTENFQCTINYHLINFSESEIEDLLHSNKNLFKNINGLEIHVHPRSNNKVSLQFEIATSKDPNVYKNLISSLREPIAFINKLDVQSV